MRIGIDHRPALDGRGGIAVYVRELVAALARAHPEDRLELYAHRLRRPRHVEPAAPAHNVRLHRSRMPAPALALVARAGLGADRLLGSVDVVHQTDFVALRTSTAPLVATVHDVLFESLPHCYTPGMRRRLAAVVRWTARAARRIVVPAPRTAHALIERFGVPRSSIDVVPHGPRTLPSAPPATELGDYVLAVGQTGPRKNLPRLVRAMRRADQGGDVRLVVVGAGGWMHREIREALTGAAFVHHEGAVDDERLGALYGGALCLAYPSLGEGFGLPVLEAMARGLPVLVGAGTTCADLAGEAGLAVDPLDEEAMGDGLTRLLADEGLRALLGAAGRARAAAYSWARTARETRAVYARAT
jgi:glycosyltransferase involved in cell wall biosynthesis